MLILVVDSPEPVDNRRFPIPIGSQTLSYTPCTTYDRKPTLSFSAELSKIRRSDLSMSPFPRELLLTCSQPIGTREYTLHPSSSGSIMLESIDGTPRSISSRFRAERCLVGFPPPTPETPTFQRAIIDDIGTPMGSPSPEIQPGDIVHETIKKRSLPIDEDVPSSMGSPIRPHKRRKLLSFFGTKELRAVDVMFALDTPTDEFSVTPPTIPTGERLYVQDLMRKSLLNPDRVTFQRGVNTMRTVWKLHDVSLIKKHEQHQALVCDENTETGEFKVFKGVVDVLGIPNPSQLKRKNKGGVNVFEVTNEFDNRDDWSYLEKWKGLPDDQLLPVFGESDSEDAEYENDSTTRETEDERVKDTTDNSSKCLSLETVRDIIEQEITHFKDQWSQKSIPKLNAKAHQIYQKHHRQRTKKLSAAKHRKDLNNVNERISAWKLEYEGMPWHSVDELKRMCAGLEESVNGACELQWRIDLLLGTAPEKPARSIDDRGPLEEESEEEFVDIEAVETDGEDIDEDMDDGYDTDVEEDQMDGFVIGDDEVECHMPDCELDFGNQDDEDEDETQMVGPGESDMGLLDDDDDDDGPRRISKRRKGKKKVVDYEDMDMEDELDEGDVGVPTNEKGPVEPQTDLLDDIKPATSKRSKDERPSPKKLTDNLDRDGESALPTPPQEPEDSKYIKAEFPTQRPPSVEPTEISGYDSDIFIVFGDEEIANFCQCTEQSARVARDYLRRADGQTERAIEFYLEDVEQGRFVEQATSPVRPKKKSSKEKGKQTEKLVVELDEDDIETEQSVSGPSRVPFGVFNFRGRTLLAVKNLANWLQSEDLHRTTMDIAEMVMRKDIDPRSQFLTGETRENCDAYWRIYLAYTHYLFGQPAPRKLTGGLLEKIGEKDMFTGFYKDLLNYLDIRTPPTPSPSKRKAAIDLNPPSSPPSTIHESPENSQARKKIKKKKEKKIKPVMKSAEQRAQEAELKKLADRERNQKKRGTFVTTTEDGSIVINLAKKASEQSVCLHPELAAIMKPHQIEGLRFMWKQV